MGESETRSDSGRDSSGNRRNGIGLPFLWIVDTIKTGSTPPSDEIKYFEPQEINWYGPGDFDKLKLGDAKRKISQLAIEQNKCRLFPSNSILLSSHCF